MSDAHKNVPYCLLVVNKQLLVTLGSTCVSREHTRDEAHKSNWHKFKDSKLVVCCLLGRRKREIGSPIPKFSYSLVLLSDWTIASEDHMTDTLVYFVGLCQWIGLVTPNMRIIPCLFLIRTNCPIRICNPLYREYHWEAGVLIPG